MKNYFSTCLTLEATIDLYVDLSILFRNNPNKYFQLKEDFTSHTISYSSRIINNEIKSFSTQVPSITNYFKETTSSENATDLFKDLSIILAKNTFKLNELNLQYNLYKKLTVAKKQPSNSQLQLSY